MWAIATVSLNLSKEQFWLLTFPEWNALLKAYAIDLDNRDLGSGVIAKLLYDFNTSKDAEPRDELSIIPKRASAFKTHNLEDLIKRDKEALDKSRKFSEKLKKSIGL